MEVQRVLIVGANRGIGFNLANEFKKIENGAWHVTGSIRPQTVNDPTAKEIEAVADRILHIDFLDEASIENAAKEYGDKPLNVFVNVGGLPAHPKPWTEQTTTAMTEKLQTMVVGPFLATKHFFPNLEKTPGSKVVNISSDFGSITDNSFGTCMAYRMAKAALNQQTVTFAREWEKEGRDITIISVNPGFLRTRLTNFDGEDDMEECIAGILKIIKTVERGDNGAFFNWNGERLNF